MAVEEAAEDSFGTRYSGLDLNAILKAIYEDGVRVRGVLWVDFEGGKGV